MKNTHERTIILFSGGKESLLNLHREIKKGTDPNSILLVYADYGQNDHMLKAEGKAVRYYSKKYGVRKELVTEVMATPSSVFSIDEVAARRDHHVVMRNIILAVTTINSNYLEGVPTKLLLGYTHDDNWNDGAHLVWDKLSALFELMYPSIFVDSHTRLMASSNTVKALVNEVDDLSHLIMCNNPVPPTDKGEPWLNCGKCFKCVGSIPHYKAAGKKVVEALLPRYTDEGRHLLLAK